MSTASGLMEIISDVPAPGGLVSGPSRDITRSARPRRRSTTASSRTSPNHRPTRVDAKRRDAQQLLRTSLPLLLAATILILIPAAWSLAYFAQLPVWKHDDPKAGQVANALIVTWPMAIIFVSTVTYFWTRRNGV